MIDRKQFLQSGAALLGDAMLSQSALARRRPRNAKTKMPLAITMWDFSWLERRWPGAGYEDWDVALDGLKARGYNAVRIDAFPHFVAFEPQKDRLLKPVWDQQVWGSPDVNIVRILPSLIEFIGKCYKKGIKVALSSWFREDADNVRMKITSPDIMADIWLATLDAIRRAGLLEAIVYMDFCNEWPGFLWAPYLKPELEWGNWKAEASRAFMARSLAKVRQEYPDLPLLYSFDNDRVEDYLDHDLSAFDLLEHHIWAVKENDAEFYQLTGNKKINGLFDPAAYRALSLHSEKTYRARPDYWQGLLTAKIDRMAAVSRKLDKGVSTTECWAIVDYKDWPLLRWDWVKELCAVGVERAAGSGQWLAISTSNFCAPQFVGMWRDVEWHQRMTDIIRSANIHQGLHQGRIWDRL
jgi:hypothetical protein